MSDALLPLLWKHRRRQVTIVVSEARDGQYLSEFARRIGYREARGSSRRSTARCSNGWPLTPLLRSATSAAAPGRSRAS